MRKNILLAIGIGALALPLAACNEPSAPTAAEQTFGPSPTLPAPAHSWIPTVNIATATGWPSGGKPTAANGMAVNAFATGLDHPRTVYVLPNGDVLVAETNAPPKPDDGKGFKAWATHLVMGRAGANTPSANRITLLRDADGDGVAETRSVFLEGLNSPFGMALVGEDFYVANSDAIVKFPYHEGDTKITTPGVKLADLPAGTINHHWTKDLTASPDGTKLYATVGSNSNVGDNGIEAETNRAAVLEVDRASGKWRVFASGLRNPNGPSWQPQSGALWVTVNERDELGNDLVPDYMTSVTGGGFYGWPYSYYGQHVDVRVDPQRPDLVAKAIVPDYALGAHTASLGLTFNTGDSVSAGDGRRRLRRPARLVESQAPRRIQGDLRAVCEWKALGPAAGCADRLPQRQWRGSGPAGRRPDRQAGRALGGRRCRQRDLARDASGEVGGAIGKRGRLQTTLPKIAPIPAVSPIANAPQNVTRTVGFSKPAPPAFAPIAPSRARNSSDPTETTGIRTFDGEPRTSRSGAAAPTEKVAADANAACTGRAVLVSEMPSSSRACAPSASFAINCFATSRARSASTPRAT